MEAEVVIKIADNIISPLGSTTAENYQAILSGRSELRFYEGLWGLPEPCVLSLIPRQQYPTHDGHTLFEELAIRSASSALQECGLDPSSPRVQFVVSTTKGNVHLLGEQPSSYEADRVLLPVAAQVIADHFRNPMPPVVVSNACTSGLTAQIVAMRLLQQHQCDYAVVIGADIQSPFIVSGFQSFKALSPTPCRPYDQGRTGLNLGEAAATIILQRVPACEAHGWQLVQGAVRNDANHISGPSRTGEGSYQALQAVLHGIDPAQLAFVNAHGTATLYNDEMESIAITRAGLSSTPVNSLKGYYGHTMGAAGVLETLLSMCALDHHTILPTRGVQTLGVSHPIQVTTTLQSTPLNSFVKLLSGFGGCNAALLFRGLL